MVWARRAARSAIRLVLPLLCCIAFGANAEDGATLSAADIAKADAAPDVQRAREAMREPKGETEAIALFTKAASKGNPVAQAYLGYLYYMGHGLSQNDRIAAVWYRRAALAGLPDAELRLGLMYLAGRDLGVATRNLQPNRAQALTWLERAATHGSVAAMERAGDVRLDPAIGRDPKDAGNLKGEPEVDKAIAWFAKAADQGSVHGQEMLCLIYSAYREDPDAQTEWCDRYTQNGRREVSSDAEPAPGLAILSSDRIPLAP